MKSQQSRCHYEWILRKPSSRWESTSFAIMRTILIANLVGGTIMLAAASVTETWAPLTLPTRDAYILGMFVVNGCMA